MDKATVYADALARAAIAIGGERRLAATLHVPMKDLRRWLRSEVNPSTEIFHKALDLLIGTGSH
jgi:hypothetical protein